MIEQVAKDILIVQGDWNAKAGEDATSIWNIIFGTSCNPMTNERGLRLIEFDSSNDLILLTPLDLEHTTIHESGHDTVQTVNTITKLATL